MVTIISVRRLDIQGAPRCPGDPPELVAASDKIRRELSWEPKHDIHSAVRSAWNFFQKQR